MPQPPHKPTDKDRNRVRIMVSLGLTREQIAEVMEISGPTLWKYYKPDLEHGDKMINATIAANLARQAIKDDFRAVPAAIFWSKTKGGFREVQQVEHSGPDGNGIQFTIIDTMTPKDPNK